jgi:hypothetical protein
MDARCLIVAVLLAGCSASERIAVEANNIGERAGTIERLATRIGEQSHDPDTIADAATIVTEAVQIRRGVSNVHAALPGVTDKVSPIWSTLRWLAIAACGAAAVWILTSSGILAAVRAALGWIPRPKTTAAQLLAAAVDDSKPETTREAIAAMRSQDREFDAAYRRALQSKQKGG